MEEFNFEEIKIRLMYKRFFSTAVGKDYSFLQEMQEHASYINKDQILTHFFLNKYNEKDVVSFATHIRGLKERFLVEKFEIIEFARTYNSGYATDNNECFSVVKGILKRMMCTFRGAMGIFKMMCSKKKHNKYDGSGKLMKLSVHTHSDLGARCTQLVIPFVEEEAVPTVLRELCILLMDFFIEIIDVIGICNEVISEELKILKDYPRLKVIFDDSIAEMENMMDDAINMISCPNSIEKVDDPMTRELLQTEQEKWNEILPKYYHKRTKKQFIKHILLYNAYKNNNAIIPTEAEKSLFGDDLHKIERVRFVVQYFDELNPKGRKDKNTGNYKLNGKSVAELMYWAMRGSDANKKDFVGYFNETYKGVYQIIEYATIWSAYSGLNSSDRDNCVIEIENFINRKREEIRIA